MSIFTKTSFDVSRKQAADILKVSTRTLDRYISQKLLNTRNIAGRIFLNRDELTEFMKQKRKHRSIKRTAPQYFEAINNEELEMHKQQLETANDRIKQLETQLDASVSKEEYDQIKEKRNKERFNKWIMYILLTILLVLQPIWLILIYY